MSTTALEKLMFTIGVTDMVSSPIASITRTVDNMKRHATGGFDAIRGGAIGLAGAGFAIKTFMAPVYDMQQALGEVKSLNVAKKELDTLSKSALAFSVKYGASATDFVRSSYDIQSAIGGLVNGELAEFTRASNVLAKATKADAATVTNYMGTMYGIFADDAQKMGKAEWVQQLTGQTALAVQMFKTTGSEMSRAFSTIGSAAQAAGVDLSEQMAVLGTLQATMSGSEAATRYRAFLTGAGKAQEKLGLKFTDTNGKLLPMVEILNRINGKYSDLQDTAQLGALKTAFGSDEAVALITNLIGKTDGLNDSITKLARNTGMQNAADMAKQMVDPWEQFTAVTAALRISFGTLLLPAINNLLNRLTDGLQVVMGWTQEFPNITRWVGYLTLGMLSLGAAVGLGSIVFGLAKIAFAGALGIMAAMKAVVIVLNPLLTVLRGIMFVLAIATNTALAPMWLVVGVVGGIIAAVGWLIYKIGDWLGWWDKLGAIMANTKWGQVILDMLGKVGDAFNKLKSWLGLDDISADLTATKTTQTTNIEPLTTMSRRPEPGIAAAGLANIGTGAQHHYGGVNIHTDSITPADWEARAVLQAG